MDRVLQDAEMRSPITFRFLCRRLVQHLGFGSTVGTVIGAILGLCTGLFSGIDLPLSASVMLGAIAGRVAGLLLGLPSRFTSPLVCGLGFVVALIPPGLVKVWPLNLKDPTLKWGVGLLCLLLAYCLHRSGADAGIDE